MGIYIGLIIWMGALSRMAGGGYPRLPFGLDQWLYALPYLLICAPYHVPAAIVAYLIAVAGKRTGHGQWMSLGTVIKKIEPERLDFIVTWFFGDDPRVTGQEVHDYGPTKLYWRCVFGLAVSGLLVVLPACFIVASFIGGWAGISLAVSGLCKGLAYQVGWALFPDNRNGNATRIGEFLTGVFAGAGLVMAYTLVFPL